MRLKDGRRQCDRKLVHSFLLKQVKLTLISRGFVFFPFTFFLICRTINPEVERVRRFVRLSLFFWTLDKSDEFKHRYAARAGIEGTLCHYSNSDECLPLNQLVTGTTFCVHANLSFCPLSRNCIIGAGI